MKNFFIILFCGLFLFVSCAKIRDSAGVNRKSLDEYTIIENPPLVIPPDFNLLPPEQLSKNNIQDVDSELAQEILFGLENENIEIKKSSSTMDQILLETKSTNIDSNIREKINEEFVNEKSTVNYKQEWRSVTEVSDAIKESENIRKQLIKEESIEQTEKNKKIKKKKRKFFFY